MDGNASDGAGFVFAADAGLDVFTLLLSFEADVFSTSDMLIGRVSKISSTVGF